MENEVFSLTQQMIIVWIPSIMMMIALIGREIINQKEIKKLEKEIKKLEKEIEKYQRFISEHKLGRWTRNSFELVRPNPTFHNPKPNKGERLLNELVEYINSQRND